MNEYFFKDKQEGILHVERLFYLSMQDRTCKTIRENGGDNWNIDSGLEHLEESTRSCVCSSGPSLERATTF